MRTMSVMPRAAAWRQAHVAHLGHAGIALGPAVLEHHHAVLVDGQIGIFDAAL
jgi:hypothetical protein